MKENLFSAGIIYLHLVSYAIICLNADTRIQKMLTVHCRAILEGLISITRNYELYFFFRSGAFKCVTSQTISLIPK